MTTSRASRVAPTQIFENYVFTRQMGPGQGLYPIPSSAMWPLEGDIGTGSTDDAYSNTLSIGFKFKFNEKIYDRFIASTNGFLILREISDVGDFLEEDYFDLGPEGEIDSSWNHTIKDRFETNGIMLCPWYDDLINTYTNVSHVQGLDAQEELEIVRGISLPPLSLDPVDSGVKYINTIHPDGGKCLIVRWRSFLENDSNPNSLSTFEVVIYENGKFEYRYDSRKNLTLYDSNALFQGATIGVFLNDSQNPDLTYWRFRDFSLGLGHPSDSTRNASLYGGCEYDPGYEDTVLDLLGVTAPYNVTMFATNVAPLEISPSLEQGRKSNWPGQDRFGCVMLFSPPVNKRKILPRLEIKKIDLNSHYPANKKILGNKKLSHFNDNKSQIYSSGVEVNYPSMLPKSHLINVGQVDLVGDFDLIGNITRGATENFLKPEPIEHSSPFVDHDRPEQSIGPQNSYFSTGSATELFGNALKQSLRDKTQIKLELPIHHQLQMFPTSSAIYYYNKSAKGFFIPQAGAADKDIMDASHAVGDGTNFGLYRPEDARGFGPIGNQIASGSSEDSMGLGWGSSDDFSFNATESILRSAWKQENRTNVMTRFYEKSVPNNPDYFSTEDETFVLPIEYPFLLEKAVFEIPIKAGPGWLNDKTRSSVPIGSASMMTYIVKYIPGTSLWDFGSFEVEYKQKNLGICPQSGDFAGPAITLSLFNQIASGALSSKDLILTGTIIPEGDNVKNVIMKQSWTNYYGSSFYDNEMYPLYIFEPEGFLSYGQNPSVTVPSNSDGFFTGTVSLNLESGVSNGALVTYQGFSKYYTTLSPTSVQGRINYAIELLTASYLNLNASQNLGENSSVSSVFLKNVDVFGRNFRGSESSGRSIFGKEFTSPQESNEKIANPLYVSPSYGSLPQTFKDLLDITNNPDFRFYTQFVVPIFRSSPSPYLLMPGDKLSLAISKMRPALASNGFDPLSGLKTLDVYQDGLEHDVWINTGSIKVTFYGSMIKNDKEYHEDLNQKNNNINVHEVIGMTPLLDQYDVEYTRTLFGSYTDDYITGSMRDSNRGRAFSIINARENDSHLLTTISPHDNSVNPSMSNRVQPAYEKAGQNRNLKILDKSERIYDTLLPSISNIMQADGASIAWMNIADWPENSGVIVLQTNFLTEGPSIGNTSWSKAFPFESRYKNAKRQTKTSDKLFANKSFNGGSFVSLSEEKLMSSFFVDREANVFFADKNLSTNKLSSLSDNDLAKIFFGFGDQRSEEDNSQNIPEVREKISTSIESIGSFSISPIIRGWKYGLYSGIPSYTSMVFRRDRYGQLRDTLEQRQFTVFYHFSIAGRQDLINEGPVLVKFVDGSMVQTEPEKTDSSNYSMFATSSLPYFDRESIDSRFSNIYNWQTVQVFPDDLYLDGN